MSDQSIDFENGIRLEEVEEGLLVKQYNEAYVARKWRLSDNTIELVEAAIESGLRWMIRVQHPQAHARWPSGRGRVYLAFSPTRENQWSVAIDSVNAAGDNYGKAGINGKYHQQFIERGVSFRFEKRNRGSGHMEVKRPDVLPTIRMMAEFDHSVLYLGRSTDSVFGFSTESDIQRAILHGWSDTPFAASASLVGDEVPVDAGANPRRIDVLARNEQTGDWLVIEIKRAEASIDAVHQIESYLLALSRRDDFLGGKIEGALVAERIPPEVKLAAENAGIAAYEVSYPLNFSRIA